MRRAMRMDGRAEARGATLVFVALSLLALLSVMALAIDLGILYVARSEAQRAADSAALAGANVFNTSTCATTDTCNAPNVESEAAIDALAAASLNLVAGAPPQINCGADYTGSSCQGTPGIQFTFPKPTEPQITVTLQRTGIPTIFAKIFGVFSGSVSATATAEAYNGSSYNSCPTPFLVPNCDPNLLDANPPNPACAGGLGAFVKVLSAGPPPVTTIANPGLCNPSSSTGACTGQGAVGEPWTLHYAYNSTPGPSGSVVPSQWSMAAFPLPGNQSNPNGTSFLVNYIQQCAAVTIGCGSWVGVNPGNSPVPIDKAVNERIYYQQADSPDGPNNGQDVIDRNTLKITAGSRNKYWPAGTTLTSDSASLVLAPVYDGNLMSPGCSGTNKTNCQVQVVAMIQMFIQYSEFNSGQETIQATILNVLPCDGTGVSTAGATVPIRLIQKPN